MKIKLKALFKIALPIGLLLGVLIPVLVYAQSNTFHSLDLMQPIPLPDGTAGDAMLEASDEGFFLSYLNDIVTWLAAILGMVCVGIFIFSGFQIMANFGNTEAVNQAKDRILSAVFGLILLVTGALLLHTINPAFFRWDDSPNMSSTGFKTVIKLVAIKTGDCKTAKEEASAELSSKARDCLDRFKESGGVVYPDNPEITVKDAPGSTNSLGCWVSYVKYCSYYRQTS